MKRSTAPTCSRLSLALLLAARGRRGGGDDDDDGGAQVAARRPSGAACVSGTISIMGVWTGPGAGHFQAVIDGFTEQNPDVDIKYTPAGDQLPTQLSTAVEGGNPPDLAAVAQPGLVQDFVDQGALKPIDFAETTVEEQLRPSPPSISAACDGTLYGVPLQGGQQVDRLVQRPGLRGRGVEPPEDLGRRSSRTPETIGASGVPPTRSAGADGWTLTDLFENIYLRMAGPEKYDQLATHEIPWTDQSVKDALTEMAQGLLRHGQHRRRDVGRAPDRLPDVGHATRSRTTRRPPWSSRATSSPGGSRLDDAEARDGLQRLPVPGGRRLRRDVVGGGDTVVMFKDNPAVQAFVEYLATPEAAEIWAEKGGFASLEQGRRPDASTRTTITADDSRRRWPRPRSFRFDLSDLQPAEFGGTVGQGMWKILQDFLAKPGRRRRHRRSSSRPQRPRPSSRPCRWTGPMSDASTRPGAGVGGSAAREAPAAGAATGWRPGSSRPPRSSSSSGWSIRPSRRSSAASYDRSGDAFVGLDNYQTMFTNDLIVTSIKNNAIWVGIVPALVTIIGLIFAVLTERVQLGRRVQDSRVHADGDLGLRGRRHVAHRCTSRTRTRVRSTPRSPSVKDVSARRACCPRPGPSTDDLTGRRAGARRPRTPSSAGRRRPSD